MIAPTAVFLHGLDSSSRGTKASWFRHHVPGMLIPDFEGGIEQRLAQLGVVLAGRSDLILVGSSYGGLMAAIYAIEHPLATRRLILLAPALNFPEFAPWCGRRCDVPTRLYVGLNDEVTPLAPVEAAARQTFSRLEVHAVEDDHPLRTTFASLDWQRLLAP